jgi:hypothetical protein
MSLEIYKSIYSRLPEDLQKIIYEYYDHEYGYFYDEFKKIEAYHKLDRYGYKKYHSLTNKVVYPIKFEDTRNILNCMMELPIVFKRLKGHTGKHIISSYEGKHIIERYRKTNKKEHCYISNGEFIIAMIYNEYIPQGGGSSYENSPNCNFNATEIIVKTKYERTPISRYIKKSYEYDA